MTFSRDQIASFISDPASIRGFEAALFDIEQNTSNIADNTTAITETAQVISDASFLVLTSEPVLGKERSLALTAGQLVGVDAGINSTFTISLADTAVTPGSYGTTSKVSRVTVDQKGRVTGVIEQTVTIAAIIGATPAADGTYALPTSITIKDGVITAIS